MSKRGRLTLALVTALGSLFVAAPAASASCQTNPDVGDICKVRDAVCNTKPGGYICR